MSKAKPVRAFGEDISKIISTDYVNYAISTVNRSIPSVVDGLKVSQRRIIQSGFELGLKADKPFRKVSRWDGHVTGTLHPHGSAANAIVNMADCSENFLPLVEGHGNLGGHILVGEKAGQKLSNDNPAAPRYLEARLSQFAIDIFDIEEEYLERKPSYDGQTQEIIEYVPAVPLALINSQSGIATGYSTNTGVYGLDKILKVLENSKTNWGDPDFIQFCKIKSSNKTFAETGRDSIKLEGKLEISDISLSDRKRNKNRTVLTITELATGSAETFLEQVKSGVENGKIENIAEVNDLSNSSGINVQVILKYNSDPKKSISQLKRFTNLDSTISLNNTLVYKGIPNTFSPIDILEIWRQKRIEILSYRNKLILDKTTKNLNLFLEINLHGIREIAELVLDSDNPKSDLKDFFSLSDPCIDYILRTNLSSLTNSNINKNIENLNKEVKYLSSFSPDSHLIDKVKSLSKKYSLKRRTALA
ncbi:MAG: DNA gyrase subunit A [Fusobacteriaceae bacterium]